jgi:type IV pilus assembly protein PilO
MRLNQALEIREPSSWPVMLRSLLFTSVALIVASVLCLLGLQHTALALDTAENKERTLRQAYVLKLGEAISLDALKNQQAQLTRDVEMLEKQLPGKAELTTLLSEINQVGLGRRLQFEVFRPGQVLLKDRFAQLPVALRVTGRYHDIGAFVADVAKLSRIVTLENLVIVPGKNGVLTMDATANTYRHLDADEVASQQAKAAVKGSK